VVVFLLVDLFMEAVLAVNRVIFLPSSPLSRYNLLG
jgi:hypothetical protein